MELSKAITQRRTIRDFSNNKVEEVIIHKALEAGLKAPSYNHLKEWDYILVRDKGTRYALTQTEKMVEEVTPDMEQSFHHYETLAKEMYLSAIPKQKRMIIEAPELLVILYRPKTTVAASKQVYDMNALASVWCCIENILLTLASHDVYGVTFIPKNTEAVKKVLSIPDELEIAAIMPFGYKKEGAKIFPQKSVKLQDKLHIDNY